MSPNVLFIFLDGVGLGANDPAINPFAHAEMPRLQALLGGRRLLHDSAPFDGERMSLLALDPNLGVPGLPQSATGQTVLLTGRNVPAEIGYHYGPKPNPQVAAFVRNGNLFSAVSKNGGNAALLNAYPPGYFQAVESGKRNYSAIPMAVDAAGIPLMTSDDLRAGRALSADFTGKGWQERFDATLPVFDPIAAGKQLAELARTYSFAFFEYWLSDYAGHGQDHAAAADLLSTLDGVLGGLADAWDDNAGLALVTSDHGNLEDLSTRRHTAAPVPLLLLGSPQLRSRFVDLVSEHSLGPTRPDLTGVAPAIRVTLDV
jgi:hypothetical protein